MTEIIPVSRVPNSPYLNQDFYVVFSTSAISTFTAAFCTVASVVSQIVSSGGSFVSMYPAGSVATGTWTVKAYIVKGTAGSFHHTTTIQIRNSDIADPAKIVYDILRSNVGTSYASTAFSTGWYSHKVRYPQVTVTRDGWDDTTGNLADTMRRHEDRLFVDTWVSNRAFGSGIKNARNLLDNEVKRILNANRIAPSSKIRHMQIVRSQELNEVADNRKVFRTRHTVRLRWDETIS